MQQTQANSRNLIETVRFLSSPEAFGQPVCPVETNHSWVFLTCDHAYKMKKPVKTRYADWRTPEQREEACLRELHLNRRLAPDVYYQTTPIVRLDSGELRVGGIGTPIDWLLVMRRLPDELMLDHKLTTDSIGSTEAESVRQVMKRFYREAEKQPQTPRLFRRRFLSDIANDERGLLAAGFEVKEEAIHLRNLVDHLADPLARGAARVTDCHGDLRPEHVCLEEPPVVIDCLDFCRELRLLDPLEEMSYLCLECERLGGEAFGRLLIQGECPQLVAFYQAYHAFRRARIAAAHPSNRHPRGHWIRTTLHYLRSCRSKMGLAL